MCGLSKEEYYKIDKVRESYGLALTICNVLCFGLLNGSNSCVKVEDELTRKYILETIAHIQKARKQDPNY